MQLTEIDQFFNNHPLKKEYFSASDSERSGCAAVAGRDVLAALGGYEPEEENEKELFRAAIAEQTIFLLLNPEYLTGAYTRINTLTSAGNTCRFNGQDSPLGQRAAALIAPLTNKKGNSVSSESTGQQQQQQQQQQSVGCIFLRRG